MRLRSARTSARWAGVLVALAGVAGSAVPLAASSGPSVDQLKTAIGGQRSRTSALAGSLRTLGGLIGRLDGQVALIEARRAAVEADLARARASLGVVRAAQAAEHARLVRLVARLARARVALARQLVSSYESDPPDVVSVVLAAHGFADLLDRLDLVRAAKEHQARVITATRVARTQAVATTRDLAGLAARDQSITAAAAAQARAVYAISLLLESRRAALADARAARLASLRSARNRTGALQRALRKLQAQLAATAGRAFGQWAIPQSIVTCESGGQNLGPNSAGASGYYQFLPSTWVGLGGSTPAAYLAPKAEQDRLAGKLWDGGRGARNWDCAAIVGII